MSGYIFNLYIHIIRTYSYYSTAVRYKCRSTPVMGPFISLTARFQGYFRCHLNSYPYHPMSAVMPSLWSKDGTDGLGAVPSVLGKSRTAHRPRPSDGTVDITGRHSRRCCPSHSPAQRKPKPDRTDCLGTLGRWLRGPAVQIRRVFCHCERVRSVFFVIQESRPASSPWKPLSLT